MIVGIEDFKNTKYRSPNTEAGLEFLTFLFKNGATMSSGSVDAARYADKRYFYVNERLKVSYSEDYDEGMNEGGYFNSVKEYKRIYPSFEEVTVMQVTFKDAPKTMLFGKTYNTEELEAALAKLETV
jgi:hypothetical protein